MSQTDPRERFSTRAQAYARGRPDYPGALLDAVLAHTGLRAGADVADVGAGTGLFTRVLLARGLRAAAVEPSAPMRAAAEEALGGWEGFGSVAGSAEDTGLPPESVDLVTCAQAFHWFDPERTREEFRRILRPPRWVALVWNTRRVEPGFAAAYEALLERFAPGYHDSVGHMGAGRDARVERFFAPGGCARLSVRHAQVFDREGLEAMLGSVSYLPAPGSPGHAALLVAAQDAFSTHARDGVVQLPYDAEAFVGRV